MALQRRSQLFSRWRRRQHLQLHRHHAQRRLFEQQTSAKTMPKRREPNAKRMAENIVARSATMTGAASHQHDASPVVAVALHHRSPMSQTETPSGSALERRCSLCFLFIWTFYRNLNLLHKQPTIITLLQHWHPKGIGRQPTKDPWRYRLFTVLISVLVKMGGSDTNC